jgi:hypothetical protein
MILLMGIYKCRELIGFWGLNNSDKFADKLID